jgi:hypothetical protein
MSDKDTKTIKLKFKQDYRFAPDGINCEAFKKGQVVQVDAKFIGIVKKGIAEEVK